MYRIYYAKQAAEDIKNLKAVGLDEKAKELIEIVKKNPFQTSPSYEGLIGNLQGYYSRRINIQHRFVYQVYPKPVVNDGVKYEGTVKVIRMRTYLSEAK